MDTGEGEAGRSMWCQHEEKGTQSQCGSGHVQGSVKGKHIFFWDDAWQPNPLKTGSSVHVLLPKDILPRMLLFVSETLRQQRWFLESSLGIKIGKGKWYQNWIKQVSVLRRLRREGCKGKVSLVCMASLRSAWDTQQDPPSKINKNEKGRRREGMKGGERRGN